jgi:hypothetical protein
MIPFIALPPVSIAIKGEQDALVRLVECEAAHRDANIPSMSGRRRSYSFEPRAKTGTTKAKLHRHIVPPRLLKPQPHEKKKRFSPQEIKS